MIAYKNMRARMHLPVRGRGYRGSEFGAQGQSVGGVKGMSAHNNEGALGSLEPSRKRVLAVH